MAELLGSLSLATDAAAGLPAETAIRTSVVAVRLAEAVGGQGFTLSDVFYAGLLRFLGCSAYSYEMAERFAAGDDLTLLRELTRVDASKPVEVVRGALRGINRSASLAARGAAFVRLAASPRAGAELGASHCELAVVLARKLGMPEAVVEALGHAYERWDGRGAPGGVRAEAIPQVTRIVQVAWRLAAHLALDGAAEAIDLVAARAGTELDPSLAAVVAREAPALLMGLDGSSVWSVFLKAEPRPQLHAQGARVEEIARVFAHFSDVKSPWLVGHSIEVAALATAAAPDADLAIAALLHDIGRVAVPNGVWDKRGPLDAMERERMRSHTFETERILARTPLFADVAAVASMAHERVDGSGYHRASASASLGRPARVLAAADVYVALVADRAHRPKRSAAEAAEVLAAESRSGRLCREAVDAVLAATGHVRGRRAALPNALTDREQEVVRLVARGLANKEIADALAISPGTVKRHLENVFDKVKVRTRAAVSVWAVENHVI